MTSMFKLYELMNKQISYDYYCQTMAEEVCDDWAITSWHKEKKHEEDKKGENEKEREKKNEG